MAQGSVYSGTIFLGACHPLKPIFFIHLKSLSRVQLDKWPSGQYVGSLRQLSSVKTQVVGEDSNQRHPELNPLMSTNHTISQATNLSLSTGLDKISIFGPQIASLLRGQ